MSRDEKERRVIDLYSQGKTYRQIAEVVRISPNDIHAILKKKEEEKNNSSVTNYQKQRQELSSKAYKLFSEKKSTVQVAITLNLGHPEVSKLYREYWKLKRLHRLYSAYIELGDEGLGDFLKLYQQLIKEKGMSVEQVVNVVEIAIHKLPYMESLYRQANDQAEKMQRTIQRLANDIRALEHKISLLDKIAFSSDQECKRIEQRVQELTEQKDRLEKWITNILNGEGYSKVKQIVKENVKAVLSERRVLISISFEALIQTLKADPEMVKLIQNVSSANDGEQYKDNDNRITQYLEFNKDNLLDLAERNYENLVEALTNNVINTAAGAASSSSNPPPSLPSSSAFLGPYNKSDTYKTDKEEMFHHSKGDIAE
jgi:DNA-binding protein YbaB/transposase